MDIFVTRSLFNNQTKKLYLNVPTQREFKTILSYGVFHEYLEYERLSCPRLDLNK